ncbi:MAG: HflX GTPase family protein, partial [Tateyamaria sp.]
ARAKVPYPIVALVGYTNAGKSTLFNRLTGADVMAKDMLFATLDPTMRRVELENGPEVILSDTVGFISDLPTELVASFRATLEEVLAADVILHVRDISHPETEAQAEDVRAILTDLGVGEGREMVEVWNKIDLLPSDDADAARARADRDDNVFVMSAITGEGIDALLTHVAVTLQGAVTEETLLLPYAEGRKRACLFDQDVVQAERQGEAGFEFDVRWTAIQKARFEGL